MWGNTLQIKLNNIQDVMVSRLTKKKGWKLCIYIYTCSVIVQIKALKRD